MSTNSDPIADLLTRIRNATRARHRYVDLLASHLHENIVRLLESEGFILKYELRPEERLPGVIRVYLKYAPGRVPVISDLKRISKPGSRFYVGYNEIPRVLGGLGISIVSTSKGVMTGVQAHRERLGGELLCTVW